MLEHRKEFLIVLDPGHGGLDGGAVNGTILEKNLNYQLALYVRNRLAGYPIDVVLEQPSCTNPNSTNKDELYIPVQRANDLKADLFLSIHTNAGGGTGTEVFVSRHAGIKTKQYQDILHQEIAAYVKTWGYCDRGKKEAGFYVLEQTNCPAVLIETLFIDTARDLKALTNADFVVGLASCIAKGICRCAGVQWRGMY